MLLFSRLLAVAQRSSNIQPFYTFELASFPAALFKDMWKSVQSALMKEITKNVTVNDAAVSVQYFNTVVSIRGSCQPANQRKGFFMCFSACREHWCCTDDGNTRIGFYCIDVCKFFLPHGETDVKPTRQGMYVCVGS